MAIQVATGTTMTFDGAALNLKVLDIDWSDATRATVDITTLDAAVIRDFIETKLIDPGILTVNVLWDAEVGAANANPDEFFIQANAVGAVVIILPAADTITFSKAISTGCSLSLNLEDRMTGVMTFKLAAAPVFAAA